MELLGQKVKEGGVVIDEKILKVDGFLNHQIDAKLMNEVGRTFYEQFKDKGITKILTIEASGIAPAIMAALHFDVPCLFAKKAKPSTLTDGYYETSIHSFTKNKTSTVIVSKEFLSEEDTVLIIDDFLANGDASLGLYDIAQQANAKTAGIGIVVEKSFQNGHQRLEKAGLTVSSLCKVASLEGNKVTGTGLPIVLGCTFTAVAPMILIGQTKGIDVLYGSLFLSGILVIIIAPFFSHLVKFFPPVVTGSVVTIIGINLMPVAMNYLAGGQGAKDYGDVKNILLGLMTLIIILVLQRFTTGFIKSIAILIGLVLGTIGAGLLGMVDINQVNHAGWLGIPVPFRFSGFSFDVTSTLVFFIVAIVSLIESTGVYHALSEITGKKLERKDFRKGYTAEGLAIVLGSIFNSFPYTAYSQNVGLVSLSGAKKNNVIYGMVVLLLICGCIPKLGALANIIPLPVLGGAMIAMFGMVMAYGVSILGHIDFKNQNNLLIIAVSVGLGTGISAVPQAFKGLGEQFAWLTQNGIVLGAISAIILNFFFNGIKYKQTEENVK